MNDQQLLEAAAKVAGVHGEFIDYEDDFGRIWGIKGGDRVGRCWNPLTDDGDALRLAVDVGIATGKAVRICIEYQGDGEADFTVIEGFCGEVTFFHGDDPASATRRAIVMAVAALAGGE